jgi:hypothetical protein
MSASPTSTYEPTDLRTPAPDRIPDADPGQGPGDEPVKDLERLVPQLPESVTVAGVLCSVNRVRTRELMLLARVLTRGIGENMKMVEFDGDAGDVEAQILGLLVIAIPEAGDEILDLLRAIVRPAETLSDDDPRAAAFHAAMRNPEVDTMLDTLGVLVRQERETFPLLVGKFRVLFDAAAALWRKKEQDDTAGAR